MVKAVYIFPDFSSFFRLSLEARGSKDRILVRSYPKVKVSTAWVLYHAHCAFNHPAEMEKDWQVARHFSSDALVTLVGMWPGPAPELNWLANGCPIIYYLL